jgi:DDE domain
MFAAEIRKTRVARMRGYPQWHWHLDEVFVKINGKLCCLWRAVDHEGEVLETVVTVKRDKAAALKFLKRIMKKYGRPRIVVTDGLYSYPAAMKEIGNADRHEVGRRLNNRAEKRASAFSTTRASHAAAPKREDATEIQLNSCSGPQPFQPGTSSRYPRGLQTETLGWAGRMAHSHRLILPWNSVLCSKRMAGAVGPDFV